MIFRDRMHAAGLLAKALSGYRGRKPLVLAVPRGGVPMARAIAEDLEGDFDVVLVRKLGAPGNPEFAIGAVDESGWTYVSPDAAWVGAGEEYIERARRQQLEVIRLRRAQYSPLRAARDPRGRVVIVVDDGLATGATMIAALHSLRAREPARLVCAVPVAPPETVEHVRRLCDEMVCLHAPEDFRGVGQFYADFGQVEDDEVVRLLREGEAAG
ncbi:MAG: phosphoribosyltransferase [Betaproteobacteria bacterium]|nr:phosphoribosyltransferase [Betaproteobacteria bacterium]